MCDLPAATRLTDKDGEKRMIQATEHCDETRVLARQALMHLSQLAGYVKTDEGQYHLRSALSHQISLLAALEGFTEALDLSGDAALVFDEGYLGYKKLLGKYGL
jgi:hypothetical protein